MCLPGTQQNMTSSPVSVSVGLQQIRSICQEIFFYLESLNILLKINFLTVFNVTCKTEFFKMKSRIRRSIQFKVKANRKCSYHCHCFSNLVIKLHAANWKKQQHDFSPTLTSISTSSKWFDFNYTFFQAFCFISDLFYLAFHIKDSSYHALAFNSSLVLPSYISMFVRIGQFSLLVPLTVFVTVSQISQTSVFDQLSFPVKQKIILKTVSKKKCFYLFHFITP